MSGRDRAPTPTCGARLISRGKKGGSWLFDNVTKGVSERESRERGGEGLGAAPSAMVSLPLGAREQHGVGHMLVGP